MRTSLRTVLGLLLVTGAAFTQTKTFDAASVKPTEVDMQKLIAQVQQGGDASSISKQVGMHFNPGRVEYRYLDLKTLISYAYKLKPYQVSGPDWLGTTRFDIVATLPKGATRADLPEMLQALLKDRFKVEAHLENKEHPVLALVVAKGGPKLVESKEVPVAIDEDSPLKDGEAQQDTPDGPVRTTVDAKTGSGTVNMGAKGTMAFSVDRPTPGTPPDLNAMAFHLNGKQMTMAGFVEMLGQFSSQMSGGAGRQIVDMTGLKGHYEVSIAIPFSDLMAMAKAQGFDVPNLPASGGAGAGPAASDPSGSGSMFTSVQALGLKLESRKAAVDQLVVDHAEKTPTGN